MKCVCAAAVMVRFDRSVRHETCEAGAVELVRRVSRCHGPGHNSATGDRWHTWSGDTWHGSGSVSPKSSICLNN